MIHARSDYNRIQDPEKKIADDEPVFLLRAKDEFAPDTLDFWAGAVELHGDARLADHIRAHANAMRNWQVANGCQKPDAPADTMIQTA
jgi:hypothetical protein